MKVIIIYSGKGGVGKTTTTANIGKVLAEQGKKVFILDADVNTPSMPVMFSVPDGERNILVSSLGYKTQKAIYVTDSAIRSYIANCIDSINEYKPDYVLIDTPPSITDVHINLLDKIKPSGLIVVTQPNQLSVTDVNRTALFFQQRNVNIIGVVENMCSEKSSGINYEWKILAQVPFEKNFDSKSVYNNSKKLYQSIATSLNNLDSVILENKKRQLFDESIVQDDIDSLPLNSRNDLRFINLSTWDYIKELIAESEVFSPHDKFLDCNDTERIGRMLKAFEKDERAYFMVTNAPSCVIQLIPGEIGEGTLTMAESYYGVPRIKYSTSQGEIVLFPHEIKPVTSDELIQLVSTGYVPTKDGRYLPPKDELIELQHSFGKRVGLKENWKEHYDNIISGNLQRANDNPELTPNAQYVVEMKNKRRGGGKRKQTIGDFKFNLRTYPKL